MTKSTIKAIVIIVVSLLLAAGAVCYLAFPTQINLEMPCAELDEDGNLVSEGTLVLKGWKYDYLLKQDEFQLDDIKVPGLAIPKQNSSPAPIFSASSAPNWYISTAVYLSLGNRFYPLTLVLSCEKDWCIIKISGIHTQYFVASIHEDYDPLALLTQYFDLSE